jgi:eukaryotic-like serine/threonine-protein kinase
MSWEPGTVLKNAPYKIEEVLSTSGGFGITYKAIHVYLGTTVVIKTPLDKHRKDKNYPYFVSCFVKEGKNLERVAQQQHPHIVRVREFFYEDKDPCLVMNYIEGETLHDLVERDGAIPEEVVVPLIMTIAESLVRLHELGLVHRDATPANIVVNKNYEPTLIDFGIAVNILPHDSSSSIANVSGHPKFAPCEQLNPSDEDVDPQIYRDPKLDIYCLAATLYFAITAKEPKTATARQISLNGKRKDNLIEPIKINSEISDRVNRAILHGMQFYPVDRPATMQQWIEILQGDRRPPRFTRRKMLQFGAMAGSSLGLAIAFEPVARVIRGTNPPPSGPIILPGPTPPILSGLSLKEQSFKSVILDSKGKLLDEPEGNNKYLEEDLGNGVKLRMIMIPGGTFSMGSTDQELLRSDDEGPVRTVKVPDFFMGQFVVTQEQWKVVSQSRQIRKFLKPSPSQFDGNANYPVEKVNWFEALEFCDRLAQLTKRPYRLPSEAEWEYACRARTQTPFHTGPTITTKYANYLGTDDNRGQSGIISGNYGDGPKGGFVGQTVEVDKFPPNAFGLYQMHGNVWEWCLDTQHSNYKKAPADGSVWQDANVDENSDRSLRGGSWYYSPRYCRSASRFFSASSLFAPRLLHNSLHSFPFTLYSRILASNNFYVSRSARSNF